MGVTVVIGLSVCVGYLNYSRFSSYLDYLRFGYGHDRNTTYLRYAWACTPAEQNLMKILSCLGTRHTHFRLLIHYIVETL